MESNLRSRFTLPSGFSSAPLTPLRKRSSNDLQERRRHDAEGSSRFQHSQPPASPISSGSPDDDEFDSDDAASNNAVAGFGVTRDADWTRSILRRNTVNGTGPSITAPGGTAAVTTGTARERPASAAEVERSFDEFRQKLFQRRQSWLSTTPRGASTHSRLEEAGKISDSPPVTPILNQSLLVSGNHASNEESADEKPKRSGRTRARNLSVVDSDILTRLQHLDLCGKFRMKNGRVVGRGALSDVFEGECEVDGKADVRVALKRLRFHLPDDVKKLFEQEIYVWSKLNHANILPLLGYAFDPQTEDPILISDWMDKGNALAYVQDNPLEPDQLLLLILGVAQGLSYLHNVKNIIHSDVKPQNILIGSDGCPMVGDFGCARMEVTSESFVKPTSTVKGTCNYWSPELLENSKHTKESDVWAFGMTVYCLLTTKIPYSENNRHTTPIAILKGNIPTFDANIINSSSRHETFLVQLCQLCWASVTPESSRSLCRPSMDTIVSLINCCILDVLICNPENPLCAPSMPELKAYEKLRPTFGVDLCDQALHADVSIPRIIVTCCNEIERRGSRTGGIYMLGGSSYDILHLKWYFSHDIEYIRPEWPDLSNVHVCASVLKLWLRELPDPLLPSSSQKELMNAMKLEEGIPRLERLRALIKNLRAQNYAILRHLILHLQELSLNSAENGLSHYDIATIFGPILFSLPTAKSKGHTMARLHDIVDVSYQNLVVGTLVENFASVFREGSAF